MSRPGHQSPLRSGPGTPWRRNPRKRLAFFGVAMAAALVVAACTRGTISSGVGWSAPAIQDGFVYVGSQDGRILSFEVLRASDRAPLRLDRLNLVTAGKKGEWQFPANGRVTLDAIYGTPTLTEDKLFVGSLDKRFWALDRQTGNIAWGPFVTEGDVFVTAALSGGLLIFGDKEGTLYALRADDGRLVWKLDLSNKRILSSPTVVDGVVYVGGMDKKLYALQADTGTLLWRFTADGAIASKPLVVDDLVYAGDFEEKFYALDRATGAQVAVFKGDSWFWNDAVEKDGVIYVGSLGGTFYALKTRTLELVWRYPAEGSKEPTSPIRSAPVIVGQRVFIAPRDGNIMALTLADGMRAGAQPGPVGERVLANLVESDGSLFIHDQERRLLVAPAGAK